MAESVDGEMSPPYQPPAASVLLVHGAWHGEWCWQKHWVPFFEARGIRASTVSLPRHDQEGSRNRIWERFPSYVSHVEEELATHGSDTVLIGHSMGGLVAQRVAERTDVRGVVLVASVPRVGVGPATFRTMLRAPLATLKTVLTMNMWPVVGSRELVRRGFYSDTSSADVVEETYSRIQNESYLAYLSMMFRLPRPEKVSAPVLVLAAENDGLFTVREQRGLARAYDAELIEIPNSGHNVMLDSEWEPAASVVAEWLVGL